MRITMRRATITIMTTMTIIGSAATMGEVLPAIAGALLLALMLGPLGSFVVWRRMAYFGDTIAHSSLLGVALSLTADLPMQGAVFLVAGTVALFLTHYSRQQRLDADTILGIMAHGGLALGLLVIALAGAPDTELENYLFGDLLSLDWEGVGRMAVIAVVVLALLAYFWRSLLITTIDHAIATVEGISPAKMQLLLTVLLAAVIAFTVKLTGVLLITALLIIPSAAARLLSRGPKQMAAIAAVIGMLASWLGICAATTYHVPTSPAMVVSAVVLFVLSSLLHRRA